MNEKLEPQSGAEQEASGILDVVVSSTMAGSGKFRPLLNNISAVCAKLEPNMFSFAESEFLPDAYQQLFDDTSLRNPRYEKYKQRQQERRKKM